jgi:hypothetical protein
MARRSALRAFLALLFAACLACTALAQGGDQTAAIGLCPQGSARLDTYTQALCDGESALRARRFDVALERFGFAAALPRVDASHELAWAGLAAAHCGARDFEAGRQWAEHFAQARRLWQGELHCEPDGREPRAQLSPFVHSRMCSDTLAADYALIRSNPQAAYAIELRARLQQVADAVALNCAATPATAAKPAAARAAAKAAARKTAAKTQRAKRSGNKAGQRRAR